MDAMNPFSGALRASHACRAARPPPTWIVAPRNALRPPLTSAIDRPRPHWIRTHPEDPP
ncbi:hypothetical protein BURK2_00172 [Burkholderiales bacterium]|nr:hypothetical protein BURK2_00172 [Burkholderiales bacterium]